MRFFNPDNWLWRGFGRLADFFILSILWMVCSIPLVTVGAASIALYDTVAHCFRYQEGEMVGRFFRTFKRELVRGILLTVVWAVVGCLFNVSYQILGQLGEDSSFWSVFSLVYFVLLMIPVGVGIWAIGLESRFAYSFGQLHKNAVMFTLGYFPRTLAVVLIFVLFYNVLINLPFLVMFLPAVMVNLQSMFMEPAFRKFMPEENEEASL